MGGQPCYLKILMNSERIEAGADILASHVAEAQANGVQVSDDAAYKIIKHLNDAENCMNKATKAFLDSQGYDGPVDHSLDFKDAKPYS